MTTNSEKSSSETFRLFSTTDNTANFKFGFFDASQAPSLPPPPCLEVAPSEVSSSVKYSVESVIFDGFSLLKGRVNTQDVFGLSNSDLIAGKYEGGLKLWEGSLDLVKTLCSELKSGHIALSGRRVLELGCGHGLPGIFALVKDAAAVHFQDFNAEVLRCLTIPNVNANLSRKSNPSEMSMEKFTNNAEIRYFAGDWSEIDKLLPCASDNKGDRNCSSEHGRSDGYDFIFMAETVYSISSLQNLYDLIKKCLRQKDGVVYMAAKKYYFGVGGGSRQFISLVEKDGLISAHLVAEVSDGSSNLREVWKLSFK